MVKKPPANAGDTGLIPSPARFHMLWSDETRMSQQLSLGSGACELQLLSPRTASTEAGAPRTHALQQEKPLK